MSRDYWFSEMERLRKLLDRAEEAGDSFAFDELFPAYETACDEYRQCVFLEAPFTGCMF